MFRENPYVECPDCGTSNKDTNWQCWKCNKEGRVTELSEVGGADAPWSNRGTVYGGQLRGARGSSAYSTAARNPMIDSATGRRIVENIFNINPDSIELEEGADMDYDDLMGDDLEIDEIDDELDDGDFDDDGDDDFEDDVIEKELEDMSNEGIDQDLEEPSMGWKIPSLGLRRRNPCDEECLCGEGDSSCQCMRRNPRRSRNPLRRRNVAPAWGGPLFRRNRNPLKRIGSSEAAAWGAPLFRRHRSRRNPIRRRNAGLWGSNGNWSSRRRRNGASPFSNQWSSPAWGKPAFRSRRNPMAQTARWEPCSKCGLAICDGSCNSRRNHRSRRHNPFVPSWSEPAWGGSLFSGRRNPMAKTARWEPCAKCGQATCDGNCGSRRRRNSFTPTWDQKAWGGPLYRKRLRSRKNPIGNYRKNVVDSDTCDCEGCDRPWKADYGDGMGRFCMKHREECSGPQWGSFKRNPINRYRRNG